MALTPTPFIDDPNCLVVAQVDFGKADGAIASVTITNRTPDKNLWGWAIYLGNYVETAAILPGQTITQTFRGASTKAGDVSELGYRI